MKDENVRFIRVKGRVIPIRSKKGFKPKKQYKPKKMSKETKFAIQSGTALASGIGISLFSGKMTGKRIKQAKMGKQLAFNLIGETVGAIPKTLHRSSELKRLSSAKKFSIGGQLLGGALLSQAVQRGLRSQGVEIDNPVIDVGAEAGSQVASHLIARGSSRILGTRPKFSVKVPSAFTRLAKDLGTRFIKKQLRLKI